MTLTTRSVSPSTSIPPRASSANRRRISIRARAQHGENVEERVSVANVKRRETLLGGLGAAAAIATTATKASFAADTDTSSLPTAISTSSSSSSTSTSAATTPQLDGAVAYNCSSREDPVRLGQSELFVTPLAIGAWSWGDKTGYWGYGKQGDGTFGREQCLEAFKSSLGNGVAFLDTAEAYGFGASEQLIGEFSEECDARPVIATKFAPLPWRGRGDVPKAARASISRLGLQKLGLYQIHWPGIVPNQTEAFMEGLGDVLDARLASAVGVSNFKASRVESSARALRERGHSLASNQIQYSLLYRTPESNDVLAACRANGVSVIAYTPLAQGLLTGKYQPEGGGKGNGGNTAAPLPGGPRAATITPSRIAEVAPLISLMRAIGKEHVDEKEGSAKTPAQVALNWCICKGTIPIAGVKSASQAKSAAGSLGWRLTRAEVDELDAVSSRMSPGIGFPTENW